LEQVGLKTTLERVGGFSSELSWANILSSGEQQMVAFARLLVARPSYAFLDEATTALDAETERRLYSQLKEFTTTIISIGYRSTLAQYHDQILELRGGGEWKLERRTP
jgi:putative ATP-binding cassette transporter